MNEKRHEMNVVALFYTDQAYKGRSVCLWGWHSYLLVTYVGCLLVV